MRHRSIALFFLILLLGGNCSKSPDNQLNSILSDVMELQNRSDVILKTMAERPDVFSDENIKIFPAARELLKATAREQIESTDQLIELQKVQIAKLKELEKLPVDTNFLAYSMLNRQMFEKKLESDQLSLENFQTLLDDNLSQQQLKNNIAAFNQKQAAIRTEIGHLENEMQSLRKNAR